MNDFVGSYQEGHLPQLLRLDYERRSEHAQGQYCDERPSVNQWMISSARTIEGGIVRPKLPKALLVGPVTEPASEQHDIGRLPP